MDQIVFKRKVVGSTVEIPSELTEFLGITDGTNVAFVADPRNGKSLKIWNNDAPRPEKKKGKKN